MILKNGKDSMKKLKYPNQGYIVISRYPGLHRVRSVSKIIFNKERKQNGKFIRKKLREKIIFILDLDYLINQHFHHKMFIYFPVIEID